MTHRVLVTGASAGIGRACAARLAQDGYDVVNIDLKAPAQALARETFVAADLSDEAATAKALAEALAAGPITRLVNNVGTVRPGSLEEATSADLAAVVSLNLRCSIQCVQALLPGMKSARFGRIVGISSRAALGKELRTVYAATKAGIEGMTRVWALELGAHGITANAVGPGPIGTELFHRVNPADSPRTKAIIEGIPVKRLGTPEDVAHAVASLLDERAGFITGQVLYVCGGMTVGNAGA
ncbi:MAG: SDR family oxidoreductase [Betaproteobacteria bacterium]|nr:SDR family oxidoreductase [Betaproteobacteria bacterium]